MPVPRQPRGIASCPRYPRTSRGGHRPARRSPLRPTPRQPTNPSITIAGRARTSHRVESHTQGGLAGDSGLERSGATSARPGRRQTIHGQMGIRKLLGCSNRGKGPRRPIGGRSGKEEGGPVRRIELLPLFLGSVLVGSCQPSSQSRVSAASLTETCTALAEGFELPPDPQGPPDENGPPPGTRTTSSNFSGR